MSVIYLKDLIPITISGMFFSMLTIAHKTVLPGKYSAFLQFVGDEDATKTAQSAAIRILYISLGAIILHLGVGYTEKQICIGIFIVCFLNTWPAITQNHLLKIKKSGIEWIILLGYSAFIAVSVLITIITIRIFIPLIKGDALIQWIGNPGFSILLSLSAIAFPFSIESLLAKSSVVIIQTIDTFKEEVYILERQLAIDNYEIKHNKFTIDNAAKENDINVVLLETILGLENFYRGRMYNKILEKILCRFFPVIALKKNISVGIAQIRLSTAEKVLRKDAHTFIKEICNDEYNIALCAKVLKSIIDKHNELDEKSWFDEEDYSDVYDYIAGQYLGTTECRKDKTTLIYSAVLRSFMEEKALYYTGTEQTVRYSIRLKKKDRIGIKYEDLLRLLEEIEEDVTIRKFVFVSRRELDMQLICSDIYAIEMLREFADKHNCEVEIY